MSGGVRPAAVAGHFYPATAARLQEALGRLLGEVPQRAGGDPPKGIIAPHAGYDYSGPIAAVAYAALAPARGIVRRVIVAGPAHFSRVHGVAVSSASAFATPLGPVAIDDGARRGALTVSGVAVDDRAHAGEHSLEVQLPFLCAALGDVAVLPLLVGRRGVVVLADVLDVLWGGEETRFVISTDLSHYLPAAMARSRDALTAKSICRLDPPDVEAACGAAAVGGALLAARRHGLDVALLDLRNSADTSGEPERVVGYGAFSLCEPTIAWSR